MHLEYFELFFVLVGWVSPARAREGASLFILSHFLYSLRVSVCFSRRAIETRIYPNSRVHLTFSLSHTHREIQVRKIQAQKKRELAEMSKL